MRTETGRSLDGHVEVAAGRELVVGDVERHRPLDRLVGIDRDVDLAGGASTVGLDSDDHGPRSLRVTAVLDGPEHAQRPLVVRLEVERPDDEVGLLGRAPRLVGGRVGRVPRPRRARPRAEAPAEERRQGDAGGAEGASSLHRAPEGRRRVSVFRCAR